MKNESFVIHLFHENFIQTFKKIDRCSNDMNFSQQLFKKTG